MRTLILCGLLAASVVAEAQKGGNLPKRPRDAAIADTNDARGYAEFARLNLVAKPGIAADAYFWASRLDPMQGEYFYGYAMGLVLKSPSLVRSYLRSRAGQSKDLRQVDSLLLRAHTIDPFLFRRFDRDLFFESVRFAAMQDNPQVSVPELNFALTQYLSGADVETRAWMAYANADFQQALKLYGEAMKGKKNAAGYHIERGRIQARIGQADSAIASFEAALKELRAREQKDVVVIYNSKAVLEHSIATLQEQRDNAEGARAAYGRALEEDLSYHPAHTRLGLHALGHGDTTAALSELELAVQLAPNEATPRFMLGSTLLAVGRTDDATEHLTQVITLEPWWATPYAIVAQAWERKADGPKALAAYEGYMARAALTHPLRPQMQQRLANLKETLGIKP
ncbi:MAG: hypothetical protein IPK85_07300 [Gemmatimonadetes bacterium]|nr:hypothetical protein [Gemmatimonadota bacterium]